MIAGEPSGFDRCAERYDEQRPADENWWQLFERLVELGELRGRRVLEIGCGTGRLARALEERAHARVWGLDASQAMVALARERGVNARVGRAEQLPFRPAAFDAVVMRMVLHLLDRPRALRQIARVLAPDGRIVVATEDPSSFAEVWFARYFPSVPSIDRARFPSGDMLTAELVEAGLPRVEIVRLRQERTISRAQALDIINSKAYSTFELLDPAEFEAGATRAAAEIPEALSYTFDWLLAVASSSI